MLRTSRVGLVLCVLLVATTVASAQSRGPQRPERPYRGLFRGGSPAGEHQLTADFQVGGGYDISSFEEVEGPVIGDAATFDGGFGYFNADLAYSFTRPRFVFSASLASTTRYTPDASVQFLSSHVGTVGLAVERRRTRLRVTQTIGYQPFLTLDIFPVAIEPDLGEALPADPSVGTPFDSYRTFDSWVEVERQVSRRGHLLFSYGFSLNDFSENERDAVVHRAGAGYQYELLRDLNLRAGYSFSHARYPDSTTGEDVFDLHSLDLGVDYRRALSLSRRTSLEFNTGGAAIRDDQQQTHYRVIGGARLSREFRRTWLVGLGYQRNTQFVQSLVEPYFSDALTVDLRGMFTPRLEFNAAASAATGVVGFANTGADSLTSYSSTVGLTFGLTRLLALQFSHTYYNYGFDAGVSLPEDLAQRADRHSVLATLNVWLPIVTGTRSQNASR